jgi:type II secretory ATPase GspE/PulE/Tfp pilus assembly ATPase PilB-like protein
LFVPSERIRAGVARGASLDELRVQARADGVVSLRDAAWDLARTGATSIAEVVRVAAEEAP